MSRFESWHNNRIVSREEGRPTRTQHHRFNRQRWLRFFGRPYRQGESRIQFFGRAYSLAKYDDV